VSRLVGVLLALAAAASLVPLGASAQSPPQPQIRVVDLMPAFFRAWDEGTGKPLEERLRLFKELVLRPNRAVYDYSEFQLDDPHLAWYFDDVAPLVPQMRGVTAQVNGSLPAAERRFTGAFPDLKPVTIYFMPSLLHFDGQTRQGTLYFGVDSLAAYYGDRVNVPVLATHELFHVYHFQVNPHTFGETGSTHSAVWSQAWSEGLATYVSQRLNPGASRTDVLFSADLGALSDERIRALACAMEPKLGSSAESDANPFFDAGRHPAGLPARGGYLVGLLVAADAGRTRSLRELALLNAADSEAQVRSGVHRLCAGG